MCGARSFDSAQYLREQSRIITERLQQFQGGKLYLEIGTASWSFAILSIYHIKIH